MTRYYYLQPGCKCRYQNLIVATIRRTDTDYETQSFDTYTSSLTALKDWCNQNGVTHIAMESTGIYWKLVFNILEESFEIILLNARHVKNAPGQKPIRKTVYG